MPEIIGTAYVRIRANTRQLGDDIRDGIKRGIKDAKVDDLGEDAGSEFSSSFDKESERGLIRGGKRSANKLKNALLQTLEGSGEEAGEEFGEELDDVIKKRQYKGFKTLSERAIESLKESGRLSGDGYASNFFSSVSRKFKKAKFRMSDDWMDLRPEVIRDQFYDIIPSDWQEVLDKGDRAWRNFMSDMRRQIAKSQLRWTKFSKALTLPFRSKIVWAFYLALPALGALVKGAVYYLSSIVAQLGYIGTAAAGASGALAGVFAGAVVAATPLLFAFLAQTKELDSLKSTITAVGDRWKNTVGVTTQKALFPELKEALWTTKHLIPLFEDLGESIGGMTGKWSHDFVHEVLTSVEGFSSLSKITEQSVPIWGALLDSITYLSKGLLTFFGEAAPFGTMMAMSFRDLTERFSNFVAKSAESGSLTKTLNTWYNRAKQVTRIFGDLWYVLGDVFGAGADSAGTIFFRLEQTTSKWREFTSSVSGRNKLKEYFDKAEKVTREVNHIIADIVRMITGSVTAEEGEEGILEFLQTFRKDVLPEFEELFKNLGESGRALGPEVNEFFKTFIGLLTELGGKGGFLAGALDSFTKMVDVLKVIVDSKIGDWLFSFLKYAGYFGGYIFSLNLVFGGFFKLSKQVKQVRENIRRTRDGFVSFKNTTVKTATKLKDFTKKVQKTSNTIKTKLSTALRGSGDAAEEGSKGLKGALQKMTNGVKNFGKRIKELSASAWTGITTGVKNFATKIKELSSAAWSNVIISVKLFANRIKDLAATAWSGITNGLKNLASKIKDLAATAWSGITTGLKNLAGKTKELASVSWTKISSGVGTLSSKTKDLASTSWTKMGDGLGVMASKMRSIASAGGRGLKTAATNMGNLVGSLSKKAMAGVTAGLSKLAVGFLGLAGPIWAAMAPLLPFIAAIAAIGAVFAAVWIHFDTIIGWIKKLWEWFMNLSTPLKIIVGILLGPVILAIGSVIGPILGIIWAIKNWRKILEFLKDLFPKIIDWFKELPGKIAEFASGLWSWITDVVPKALGALGGFLWSLFQFYIEWIVGFPLKIAEFAIFLFSWIWDAIPGLLRALGDFAGAIFTWVGEFMGGLPGKFLEFAGTIFGIGGSIIASIVEGIQSGVGAIWGWIAGFFIELPGKFMEFAGTVLNIGKAIIDGIVDGIKKGADVAKAIVNWIVDKIPGPIKKLLGIKSPSTVMAAIGKDVVAGLAVGISKNLSSVENSMVGVGSSITDVAKQIHPGIGVGIDIEQLSTGMEQYDKIIADSMETATKSVVKALPNLIHLLSIWPLLALPHLETNLYYVIDASVRAANAIVNGFRAASEQLLGVLAKMSTDVSISVIGIAQKTNPLITGFNEIGKVVGATAIPLIQYHSGGLVGTAGQRRSRGGLAADEIPAVLQRGEMVFSKTAVREYGIDALMAMNQGEVFGGRMDRTLASAIKQALQSLGEGFIEVFMGLDQKIRPAAEEMRSSLEALGVPGIGKGLRQHGIGTATGVVDWVKKEMQAIGGDLNLGAFDGSSRGVRLSAGTKPVAIAAAKFLMANFGRWITSIGGYRPTGSVKGSDHPRGLALDVMLPKPWPHPIGFVMVDMMRELADELRVKYLIYADRIWKASTGFRESFYSHPHGSNYNLRHLNHVHASFYGDGGIASYRPGGRLAVVAEKTSEAIMPLDKLSSLIQTANISAIRQITRTHGIVRTGAERPSMNQSLNITVKIGDRDITDIVDVQIDENMHHLSRTIYQRG